ncbi:hypothetical protein N7532_002066 [Penicillium argentinense]|uniref:Uncharacterized protein n=1 Tax=Penicillium argentinense TaxID=1131581 RepID=A0A9W9G3V9_9EURO|nr:uncharacterized protein N7532_002066 [Penicillium argentinense]KAJ5111531.1 hypothetical protein N7532_002066 [Penicillium argentinense]
MNRSTGRVGHIIDWEVSEGPGTREYEVRQTPCVHATGRSGCGGGGRYDPDLLPVDDVDADKLAATPWTNPSDLSCPLVSYTSK